MVLLEFQFIFSDKNGVNQVALKATGTKCQIQSYYKWAKLNVYIHNYFKRKLYCVIVLLLIKELH